MIKEAILYFVSFFPLIFIPFTNPRLAIIFLLFFFVILPFFGGFWRQLQFHDGVGASFCWLFLAYILPFPALSVIIIYLILFWFIFSGIFIYNKELLIRRREHKSIFINFKSHERPIDWQFCPLESIQRWSTMVQGISKHRPLPVRILLYSEPLIPLSTMGFAWESWYEAVIMLNKDFLKLLSPGAQKAMTAKYFGELLGRNFTNLKNEIYWWGLLISWTFGLLVILLPHNLQFIFEQLPYQVIMVLLSLFVGYLILTFRLRQFEHQSDLRSADLTDIKSILEVYEVWENEVEGGVRSSKFTRLFSSYPVISKRKEFLTKFTEIKENEVLAFERLIRKEK